MPMRVMLVGCNGQLGTEVSVQLAAGGCELGVLPPEYTGHVLTAVDFPEFDVTKREAVLSAVSKCAPDVVINCAGYTDVDGCETHREEAFRVNALGVRNLAMACETVNAKLVHVSTDYVFSGVASQPYGEYDLPAPTSMYGLTKYAGERYAQAFCTHLFLVRTSWLYGRSGRNFLKTIVKNARLKGKLIVVNDQLGNPTCAVDLSWHLLRMAVTDEYGVYHCTGNGICSWYDFACEIVKLRNITAKVEPCSSAEYPSLVQRPPFSALEHLMLRATIGDRMRPWQEALADFLVRYHNEVEP